MIIQGKSYLTDPNKQFVTKGGAPNVGGFVRVYLANTDDPATTYSDFNGTANPQEIRLDNNGRAVIIADASKAYRVEVYSHLGELQWTVQPLFCLENDSNVSRDEIYKLRMTRGGTAASVYDPLQSPDTEVDINETEKFDITQPGIYAQILQSIADGRTPVVTAGSSGKVKLYYYTSKDEQNSTVTFTCGHDGIVELLVLHSNGTYEFTEIHNESPSILIAQKWGTHYVSGTDTGTDSTDGVFLFQEQKKLGDDIWVDESDHKIYCKKGLYHFDFQVFFFVNPLPYSHNGGTQPRIDTVHVSAGGYGQSMDVDLDRGNTQTYHTTAQFGADIYASSDGFNVSAAISGLGYGSFAYVSSMAIHKIAEDE